MIALGTVADAPFPTQVAVLVGISILMTIGVYGIVAGIVKLDDAGLYLSRRESAAARAFGRFILAAAPWLMKALSVAGTAAMFLVGGGILVHGIPPLHHLIEAWSAAAGGGLGTIVGMAANAVAGVIAGAAILLAVSGVRRLWPARAAAH